MTSVYTYMSPYGNVSRQQLILALVMIWGVRLSAYLTNRNWGQGEDKRYMRWRRIHGNNWWWRSFFIVFLLQDGLGWLISLPLMAAVVSLH